MLKEKKEKNVKNTAVPVPHLCPNSLTSGRKWDSTYQMRTPLQFFNLCFESCLILNEMKRLDVIFPLIKCIVIYNHNNSPGMSLRNEFFCFIPYPTYPTYILHILQITTKNFVQFSIFNFFAPRKLCSTFFCLP